MVRVIPTYICIYIYIYVNLNCLIDELLDTVTPYRSLLVMFRLYQALIPPSDGPVFYIASSILFLSGLALES
jgi:hypothetical protein